MFSSKKEQHSEVLEARDVTSVAKYIKSHKCRNIIFMLGAGVSTSAGIPDFRSPDTGLYANLQHLNLPSPEAVFDIGFFRRNPKPFYVLSKELRPGKFRPTLTHSFVRLIHEKNLLLTCFTQNIDTLERRAGVPENKLVEAHGSFASQRCIECKRPYDDAEMEEAFERQKVAKCPECLGLVKPDIVFFGEQLPTRFFKSLADFEDADLLIIIGTSLSVFPFANLITLPPANCPRVFINLERVNNFNQKRDDVVLLGRCDHIIELLSKELGWHEELLKLWNETEIKAPGAEVLKPADEEVKELAEAISKQMKLEEGTTSEKTSTAPLNRAKDGVKSEAIEFEPSDLSGQSLPPEDGSISAISERDLEAPRSEETLATKGEQEEEKKQKAQQETPTSEDKQGEKQKVQDEAEAGQEGKL